MMRADDGSDGYTSGMPNIDARRGRRALSPPPMYAWPHAPATAAGAQSGSVSVSLRLFGLGSRLRRADMLARASPLRAEHEEAFH